MIAVPALSNRLRRDITGVALIEFAICVPMLLLLFIGGYQLSDGVFAYRKVTATARTVADLTSQYTSVNNADLDTILNASQQVLTPYKLSAAEIRVSQVTVTNGAIATVNWSRTTPNTSPYAPGTTFAVPSNYKMSGTTVIWAEITYHYVPSFASGMIGNIDLKEQVFMYPRKSTTITKT